MRKVSYQHSVITLIILLFSAKAGAQHNYGIATSNWSSINSIYLNPANIADSRERFSISLFSISAGADNNLGSIGNNGLISSLANGTTKFEPSNKNQFSLLAPYVDIHGPGFMMSINNRHSIALTTRIRGINQFSNFDQSLYRTITDPNYIPNNDIDLTSNKFNYTAHVWSEIGLSYGVVLLDQENSELKAGVTLRYLGGIGYIGLKGNNLDAHFKAGNDSFYASNSNIEYASNVLSTKSAVSSGFSNNSILSQFFGSKSGDGFGADIGVTYDYIPDKDTRRYNMDGRKGISDGSKNRYLVRISASVMDIGAISYSSSDNSNARVSGNGYLTGQGLKDNVTNFEDFRHYVVSKGFHADTIHRATKLQMPTMLLLGVDYHAYGHLYANLAFAGNLASRESFGNSYYNQLTLTPRFDSRNFSFGLPIGYSMLSNSVKLGVGMRITGFFIGSDDMLALFSGHQYGFNFYVGGSIPFFKAKMRDRDGDGVSDRKDRCPDDYGPWENNGCPVKEGKEPADAPEKSHDKEE